MIQILVDTYAEKQMYGVIIIIKKRCKINLFCDKNYACEFIICIIPHLVDGSFN